MCIPEHALSHIKTMPNCLTLGRCCHLPSSAYKGFTVGLPLRAPWPVKYVDLLSQRQQSSEAPHKGV